MSGLMMRPFLCLFMLLPCVLHAWVPTTPENIPTLDGLATGVADLENQLRDILFNVTDIKTLAALADEKLNFIRDINRHDARNYDRPNIQPLQDQLKAIRHRVDNVMTVQQGALSLARETNSSLDHLTAAMIEIQTANVDRQTRLTALTAAVDQEEQDALSALGLLSSSSSSSSVSSYDDEQVAALEQFVNNRMCEYGEGSFDVESLQRITFALNFTQIPNVTVALTGFRAHMECPDPVANRHVGFNSFVTNVDPDGFSVSVVNSSLSNVEIKEVYTSWMACQGLDNTFLF